ncbi:hypothetical protein EVAR_5836_1 [Eumeta japonica]|uniref:Uncharacterized protein n=1 Tax=Eumeta variegata TaxID=151549 RepID=A0A4C1TEI9_EUMVA|nr:hypothetical protein EVAR_5836_1 [Eumeta japonica]
MSSKVSKEKYPPPPFANSGSAGAQQLPSALLMSQFAAAAGFPRPNFNFPNKVLRQNVKGVSEKRVLFLPASAAHTRAPPDPAPRDIHERDSAAAIVPSVALRSTH